MKTLLGCLAVFIFVASFAFGASLNFTKPLNDATKAAWGETQKLSAQNAVDTELRAKMQAWATFSGYSAGTTR